MMDRKYRFTESYGLFRRDPEGRWEFNGKSMRYKNVSKKVYKIYSCPPWEYIMHDLSPNVTGYTLDSDKNFIPCERIDANFFIKGVFPFFIATDLYGDSWWAWLNVDGKFNSSPVDFLTEFKNAQREKRRRYNMRLDRS